MDEFDKHLNPDNNRDNLNTEDNKAFDFDLSILDKVKPPRIDIETISSDDLPKMKVEEPTSLPTESIEIQPENSESTINTEPIEEKENPHFIETSDVTEESTSFETSEENTEYNENPFINNNPYEEAIENTNPYIDYDDMDEVIGNITVENPYMKEPFEEQTEENIEEYNEPEIAEKKKKEEKIDEIPKVDEDFKELEKIQKKKEKKEKIDNMKFIFIFLMFVVIAALIAYFHSQSNKGEPKTLPKIDINTKDKDKDKDKDKNPDETIEPAPPVIDETFDKKLEEELDSYYNNGDSLGLSNILSSSYNDETKVKDIHNITYTKVVNWIDNLTNQDSDSYETFNGVVNNTRSKIDTLHNIKYAEVLYIEENQYQELSSKIDKIEADSNDYYVALELYNNKDYNNAYKAFQGINNNSYFYDASVKHMNDIVNNILDLLKDDINTLSTNLEYVNDEEQQNIYMQIKGIIEKYAIAYPYVQLTNNEEYNSLVNKYNELIKE